MKLNKNTFVDQIKPLLVRSIMALSCLGLSGCMATSTTEPITPDDLTGSPSPWDNQQIEPKVTMPVNYPQVFSRERHLFGYAPRFMPGQISFTPKNRPVIRFGMQGKLGEHTTVLDSRPLTSKNFIQYLGQDGRWYILESHVTAIRSFLKLKADVELLIQTGHKVAERVEFDAEGHAYTLASVKADGKWHTLLLYSSNPMKKWQVINLPKRSWRIESYQTNNSSTNPPVLVAGSKDQLMLIAPTKSNRRLVLPPTVTIPAGTEIGLHGLMSGAGNNAITVDKKTFICYFSLKAHPGFEGTPQYIVSYDHQTGESTEPVFLGVGGHRVDGHNSPVILADSKGYIHVLLGTHWHSMVHCISKNPADISAWQKPHYVAGNGDNSWSRNGITYPGFTIDKNDTLHLVVRGRNSRWVKQDVENERIQKGYPHVLDYALVYLRKKKNGSWEPRKDLVRPSHMAYSNWYQKISVDRLGMPYLSYSYYAHNLTASEKKQYVYKWGGSGENTSVKAHDPVLIRTADGGDSWSTVTTTDLAENMTEK